MALGSTEGQSESYIYVKGHSRRLSVTLITSGRWVADPRGKEGRAPEHTLGNLCPVLTVGFWEEDGLFSVTQQGGG